MLVFPVGDKYTESSVFSYSCPLCKPILGYMLDIYEEFDPTRAEMSMYLMGNACTPYSLYVVVFHRTYKGSTTEYTSL